MKFEYNEHGHEREHDAVAGRIDFETDRNHADAMNLPERVENWLRKKPVRFLRATFHSWRLRSNVIHPYHTRNT